jgi:Na+-translocating ferredoxin:NAD+ oxidoreductase RnfG subunit
MAVSAAPQKKQQQPVKKVSEDEILKVINNGGQPAQAVEYYDSDEIKGIGIKLLVSEIEQIKTLRNKRTPIRGKKITISLHDWIIEAIQDKITKEKKQYDS